MNVEPQNAPTKQALNRLYDERMFNEMVDEYYSGSRFLNFGYWENQVQSPKEASENLLGRLLSFIPEKKGTILDVACGTGATTRFLLNFYPPEHVTGINISAKQLDTCRQMAPGCRFLEMDAAALQFSDASFDAIICVEAAFHFHTREKFLQEALRVLKTGGILVLSDAL
ncbi:MAG: class I SAM-dependent methyltransferase, partial [Desulfobulbaceae bacterium]|nr:class I SAM-dependent methyltransferase [Desulfobulbaceae bacterium]